MIGGGQPLYADSTFGVLMAEYQPKWTKQDYEAVAEVLHNTEMTTEEQDNLLDDFGSLFIRDNSRFDFGRFRAAVYRGELTHRSHYPPKWTTRDFRVIAEILKIGKESGWLSDGSHARLVSEFAEKSMRMNPNFKREMFEKAARRRVHVGAYRRVR